MFARKLGCECRVILDFGTQTGCFALVVEGGASYGVAVSLNRHITGNHVPKAVAEECEDVVVPAVNRGFVNRQLGIGRYLALRELALDVDFKRIDTSEHLALAVDRELVVVHLERSPDFTGVLEIGLLLEVGSHRCEHLHLLLVVGVLFLLVLEAEGCERKQNGYDGRKHGCVDDCIGIAVAIHNLFPFLFMRWQPGRHVCCGG